MPRIFPSLSGLVTIGAIIAAVAACGASPTPSSSVKLRPQPGHVIRHPSAAQAFIYQPQTAEREANGDLLITDAGNWNRTGAKIVELSSSGKPLWEYTGGLDFPHSAYPVGKNDILISDTNNDRVIMINRNGKTLWDTDNLGGGKGFLGQGRFSDGLRLLYPNDAVMEPHDQVLISSRMNSTVFETTMQGRVTWKCAHFMFRQHRPRLLPNGDLMVADSDHGQVLTINHACNKILFQYGGFNSQGAQVPIWPRSFNPYVGGTYLVGDSIDNQVLQINSHKKIIRKWTDLAQPYYLEVEKNGDILLGDTDIHGAVDLSPKGGVARQYSTHNPNHYPNHVVNGGFENGTRGWIRGDLLTETLPPGRLPDMGVTHAVHHSGKASAFITWSSNTSHLEIFWQQTVAVKAGKTYRITGWLKAKNVLPCSGCDQGPGTLPYPYAYYALQYVRPGNPHNPPDIRAHDFASGTTGWKKVVYKVHVPSGVTAININGILLGRGTAYFDGVSLTAIR